MSAIVDFDPASDQGDVPSPCINVCSMNPHSGLCEGCLRTIDEIAEWSTASQDRKRAVWLEIKRRQVELF
jgi:predicted Fe-S protein YdhL (DUF1289 family)